MVRYGTMVRQPDYGAHQDSVKGAAAEPATHAPGPTKMTKTPRREIRTGPRSIHPPAGYRTSMNTVTSATVTTVSSAMHFPAVLM